MNFMRKKWIQKTSAYFLLTLFVFIHAVKILHTHDYSYTFYNTENKNAAILKAGFTCAICDFQIAKDSDAEYATLNISTPLHFITAYYNYTSLQLHAFSISSSIRGPPSIIL